MPCALVIGGGIGGLAAAWSLRNSGFEVELLQSGPRVGGSIRSTRVDGFLLEDGPDCFLTAKPEAVQLCRDLGLGDRLIGTIEENRRSLLVNRGSLKAVPEGFYLLAPVSIRSLLKADLFSWSGRLRMALDLVIPRRTDPGDESLASFVRRRLGREALERLAQPMAAGITTADPETLSLHAALPQFRDMEREHRSVIRALLKRKTPPETRGPRYGLFASLDGGLQVLVDALESALAGCVHVGSPVSALRREGSRWIATVDHHEFAADAVVMALPAPAAARLLRPVSDRLASLMARISFASVATVQLAYIRDDLNLPAGMGFVVPAVENRFTLACTFASRKFAGRAPAGKELLRAFVGGASHPERVALPDDQILSAVKSDLRDLLDVRAEPCLQRVCRLPGAMPQYRVGHLDLVADIESLASSLPGLFLAGNSWRGSGIPDTVAGALRAAESVRAAAAGGII